MRSQSLSAASVFACLSLAVPALADAQVPPSSRTPRPETGITGSLLDPDYEPLAGYRVQFVGKDGSVVRVSAPIDEMGRFGVPDLPPGVYEVRLVTEDGRPCEADIPPVEIGDSGKARLTTILPKMPVCAPPPEKPPEPVKPAEPPKPPSNLAPATRRWVIVGSTIGAIGLALLLADDDDPPPQSAITP